MSYLRKDLVLSQAVAMLRNFVPYCVQFQGIIYRAMHWAGSANVSILAGFAECA